MLVFNGNTSTDIWMIFPWEKVLIFFTLHNFKSSTTLRWGRDTWRSSKLPQAICKRTQHCWATTPNIVGCYMLCPFANPIACCCVLLCKVWNRSNSKPSANGRDIVGRQVPTLYVGSCCIRLHVTPFPHATSLTSTNSTTPTTLKVMLHGTIRNDDF